jgi:hypothetical protein
VEEKAWCKWEALVVKAVADARERRHWQRALVLNTFLFLQAAIVYLWSCWIFLPFLRVEGATICCRKVSSAHADDLFIHKDKQFAGIGFAQADGDDRTETT